MSNIILLNSDNFSAQYAITGRAFFVKFEKRTIVLVDYQQPDESMAGVFGDNQQVSLQNVHNGCGISTKTNHVGNH
jgi:hypothetical protein